MLVSSWICPNNNSSPEADLTSVMGGKGPSSLPCMLARDGEDLGFMSLPMGKEGKEEGEGKGQDGVGEGRGGGVLLRGGVWVLHERLLARWKER